MFYIVFLFHILLFIESYLLYKKRIKKKSLILLISNTILMLINLLKFLPTFKIEYSTVIYFEQRLIEHSILGILWILLNNLNLGLGILCIKIATKKKVQNKALKNAIYLLSVILIFFFTVILFQKNASIINLFLLLYLILLLIRKYKKTKQNTLLILLVILGIGMWYSYFTYTGAARYEIFLKGYIKEAYETGLEELKFYEEKNNKKFSPIQSIKWKDGEINIIEVKKYLFLKFGKTS